MSKVPAQAELMIRDYIDMNVEDLYIYRNELDTVLEDVNRLSLMEIIHHYSDAMHTLEEITHNIATDVCKTLELFLDCDDRAYYYEARYIDEYPMRELMNQFDRLIITENV